MPPPSAAASVVLPFANSMFLSAIVSVLEAIEVVVPFTVRLPEMTRLLEIVPPESGKYVDEADDCVRYVLDALDCVK